jgi:hypothetical protein
MTSKEAVALMKQYRWAIWYYAVILTLILVTLITRTIHEWSK